MDKIIDYKFLCERGCDALEEKVVELIALGFQPFGSPSMVYVDDESKIYSAQAMVKYSGAARPESNPG
jgi:hypothetical protein